MKEKIKPKYSIWSNVYYMLKLAWNNHKSVLWLCIIWAALALGIQVARLFIAPTVLEKMETQAPLGSLFASIGIFSLALVVLNGPLGYVDENILYGRISIRSIIINELAVQRRPNVLWTIGADHSDKRGGEDTFDRCLEPLGKCENRKIL